MSILGNFLLLACRATGLVLILITPTTFMQSLNTHRDTLYIYVSNTTL